ncbi:phage major tail tube protein [Aurantimonas sp. DM33-3]|uniref:phage major tail tube protein n=1 Tax=Aurantimonas sp. DM33-3 TaxID=2766955 RepID=UPI001651B715|nr:phage major tail tube protein [Aurantimonas sp. DM33-3]MBC6714803.1 phage major tail tube protein [Aurantimonas sp. DM33-3]
MRHIMQGFTMHIEGLDFGIDTEEVTLPLPTPVTQEYRGGGMGLGMNMAMAALEALEPTIKMAGHNPDIMRRMAKGPGQTTRVTFRGAFLTEASGVYVPHVCVIEGAPNPGSRDTWQRGEKSGIEFMMNTVKYMRYDVGDEPIHEVSAWPPKWIVDGIDQIGGINGALGYL